MTMGVAVMIVELGRVAIDGRIALCSEWLTWTIMRRSSVVSVAQTALEFCTSPARALRSLTSRPRFLLAGIVPASRKCTRL